MHPKRGRLRQSNERSKVPRFLMFKIGAFAVIFDSEQRVLLSHRKDYDLWNLPGGGLEEGETPWDGVIREVKEETGLVVQIVRLAGIYSKPQYNEILFSFICEINGGDLEDSLEADKHEYFSVKSLPANTVKKQVERIQDAMSENETVVLKTQEGPSSIELLEQGKLLLLSTQM